MKHISEYDKLYDFEKHKETDQIYWTSEVGVIGSPLFSFDQQTIYNLYQDYSKLTKEQKEIFDRENPYLVEHLFG